MGFAPIVLLNSVYKRAYLLSIICSAPDTAVYTAPTTAAQDCTSSIGSSWFLGNMYSSAIAAIITIIPIIIHNFIFYLFYIIK